MAEAILTWTVAYALGSISGGYYLVALLCREDVRGQGSGAVGATNAARLLGRRGFALVFLWDVAKGALALIVARLVGLEGWALGATTIAVTVGHIWPFQLGFRGGRGVATAWGAFLAYVPWMALLEVPFAAAGAFLLPRVSGGGMLGILLGAVVVFVIRGPSIETAILGALMLLLLFTHRGHLARLFRGMRTEPDTTDAPETGEGPSELVFRVATEAADFEQIARLNYETFVEEIPQHAPNAERKRVDPFLEKSTLFVCEAGGRVVGMLSLCGERPFSLDKKLEGLDRYLPEGCENPCEVRLLAVEPGRRGGRIAMGLISLLARHSEEQGYDCGFISAAASQGRLYEHLGFTPFGPEIGTPEAPYRGMVVTWADFSRSVRRFEERRGRRQEGERT